MAAKEEMAKQEAAARAAPQKEAEDRAADERAAANHAAAEQAAAEKTAAAKAAAEMLKAVAKVEADKMAREEAAWYACSYIIQNRADEHPCPGRYTPLAPAGRARP